MTESKVQLGALHPAKIEAAERLINTRPRKSGVMTFRSIAIWLVLFYCTYVLAASIYLFLHFAFSNPAALHLPSDELQKLILRFAATPAGVVGVSAVQTACVIPMLLLAASKSGEKWEVFLGFAWTRLIQVVSWLGILLLFLLAEIGFGKIFGNAALSAVPEKPTVPLVVAIAVMKPLLEELLFRGYLYGALRLLIQKTLYVHVLTSFLFAIVHLGTTTLFGLLSLFILSIILGLARERSGSLLVPLLLHVINNALSITALLLA